ncbi:MAG TPA: class I SAM-dependent methyltransferase [Gemmata sp.]
MAKQNEIEYAQRMNPEHAANKPFSDRECGRNLIRLGTVMTLLPAPPARVLDLGCGTGWTSSFLARAGYEVVGVDLAPEMIRLADQQRAAAGLGNLSFRVSDYEHLDFRAEFDCAVFFDALHHADDEALALRRAGAALKPGGVCVAVEPGFGHHASADSRHAVAEFGVTEKDMPPDRVVTLARAAGFTEFRVFPPPDELSKALYETRKATIPDPFADFQASLDTAMNRGLFARLWWRLRLAVSPARGWRRDLDYLLCHSRWNGLVLMRKGAAPPGA